MCRSVMAGRTGPAHNGRVWQGNKVLFAEVWTGYRRNLRNEGCGSLELAMSQGYQP